MWVAIRQGADYTLGRSALHHTLHHRDRISHLEDNYDYVLSPTFRLIFF